MRSRATHRQLRQAWETAVDWDASVLLDADTFETRAHYDAHGRVTTDTQADGLTRAYGYGRRGNVQTLTVTVADGTLAETTIAEDIQYSARGERAYLTMGNGVEGHYTWNRRTGRLDRYEIARTDGTRVFADVRYTYDPAGNIRRWIDDKQEPGATGGIFQSAVTSERVFGYDAHSRLVSASGRYHQALLPGTGAPQRAVDDVNIYLTTALRDVPSGTSARLVRPA